MQLDHSLTGKSIYSSQGRLLDQDIRVVIGNYRIMTIRGPRKKFFPATYGYKGFFYGSNVRDLLKTIASGMRTCR